MTITAARTLAGSIERFRIPREPYTRIVREITKGIKQTHWMWYVFPQLRALAKSETALYYGIGDQDEARRYLGDVQLRARLGECTLGILRQRRLMFNETDSRKLQACMTLFRSVAADPSLPNAVLTKFYGGMPDQRTLDFLSGVRVESTTAMGRVEMGRSWEKRIERARSAVETIGVRPDRGAGDPMYREDVEKFVRGFGLSAAAVKRIVDEWLADQGRARSAGWDDAYQSYME